MTAARDPRPLKILCAGSLHNLLVNDLLPRFQRLTGYRCEARAGGSRELARLLRQGECGADLFLSADAAVNETELMRPEEKLGEWYLEFATNELGLAYNPDSSVSKAIERLSREENGWQQVLVSGFRLGRPDPEADPKGYRVIFAMQLAETELAMAGLLRLALGPARNAKQVYDASELTPMLRRGELDIVFSYRSQAQEEGLAFMPLPDEINLGSLEHAAGYPKAQYRCGDGTTYQGSVITYTGMQLSSAQSPLAAAAFLVFLTSRQAARACQRHGFRARQVILRVGARDAMAGGKPA